MHTPHPKSPGLAAGVTEDMVVFSEEPRWADPEPSRGGRPRTRPRLAEDAPRLFHGFAKAADALVRAERNRLPYRESHGAPAAGWSRARLENGT